MTARDLITSIRTRDEAKPTAAEVVFAYPGFHILTLFYPLAHFLWHHELHALARWWMWVGHMLTGIDIHPAAEIGDNLFIDHGTGVVIGQTAIIGDDCRIYHNVTLGGRGGFVDGRRHPKIGNRVIIGAGALVLGPITIGDDARIGAGAVVTTDVPACATAIGNPARIIENTKGDGCYGLPDGEIDDPLAGLIKKLEGMEFGGGI